MLRVVWEDHHVHTNICPQFFDKIIDTGTFCCFTSSTKIQDHLQLTTLSTVLHDVSNYHQENGTSFLVCSDMVDERQT